MKGQLLLVAVFSIVFFSSDGQTIYCVTNNLDSGPGSLRSTISNSGNGNIVDMSAVAGQTIILTSPITIPNTVTINGYNAVVSGNNVTGIFSISGTSVTLNSLVLSNGYNSSGSGGAININGSELNVNNSLIVNNTSSGNGGGIFSTNNGIVNLMVSTVTGNISLGGAGGGISSNGSQISGLIHTYLSIISNNQVLGSGLNGGGIDANTGCNVIVESTLISNNTSKNFGGGISIGVSNIINITNSTVYGNTSGSGGGINSWGSVLIQNSTFVSNQAINGDGGAFILQPSTPQLSSLTLVSSLIVGNTASGLNSGGVYIPCSNNVELDNNIFSGNLANGSFIDIYNGNCGINSTFGHNLFNTYTATSSFVFSPSANITGNGSVAGTTNIVNNSLVNNGGSLPTLSIPNTSPAKGWGVWPTNVLVDGRGYLRSCANDAGAYQIQRFSSLNLSPRINTLCGQSLPLTLNSDANISDGSFLWFLNGTSITGATSPTYNITSYTAGTYKVRVYTGINCYQEDSIVVMASLPPTTISPRSSTKCAQTSVSLCNTPSVNLSATTIGPDFSYQWKYAKVPLPGYAGLATITTGGTSSTLSNINTAGIYQVTVSALGCAPVSDTISLVASTLATPNNYTACPAPNSIVGLSVSGSGKYKWYTSSIGGAVVGTGNNVKTLIPLTATTSPIIYYVSDTTINTSSSVVSGSVGPPTSLQGGYAQYYYSGNALVNFTLSQNATILSMQIPLYVSALSLTITVTVQIYNASGNPLIPAQTFTSYPVAVSYPGGLYTFSFSGFNLSTSWGSNLKAGISSISSASVYPEYFSSGNTNYPYNSSPSGIISITGVTGVSILTPIVYGPLLNWQFQSTITTTTPGSYCARVPVIAQVQCPLGEDMLAFEALPDGDRVDLTWSDVRNSELAGYIVEKSKDGVTFNSFEEVSTNGTINKITNYTIVDDSPFQGKTYYRLKRTYIDGTFGYSDVKSVAIGDVGLLARLFPNPASGDVNLEIEYNGTGFLNVQIINSIGNIIYSSIYSPSHGSFYTLLPTSLCPKGVYFVKIVTISEDKLIKLIVN